MKSEENDKENQVMNQVKNRQNSNFVLKELKKSDLFNLQKEVNKKENLNDEDKPIYNYPYEFYDENNSNKNEDKKDNMSNNNTKNKIETNLNNIKKQNENIQLKEKINKEEKNEEVKSNLNNKIIPEIITKVDIKEEEDNNNTIKEENKNVKEQKKEIKKEEKKDIQKEKKDIKQEKNKDILKEKKEIKDENKEIPKENKIIVKEKVKDIKKEDKNYIMKREDKNIKEERKEIPKEKEILVIENNKDENKNLIRKEINKKEQPNKIIIKEISNKKNKKEEMILKNKHLEKKDLIINENKGVKKEDNKLIKKEENKIMKNDIKKENIKEDESKINKEKEKIVIKIEDKNIKKGNNKDYKIEETKKIIKLQEKKFNKKEGNKNNKKEENKVNNDTKEKIGLIDKIENTEKLKDSEKKDGIIKEIILKKIEKKALYPSSSPKEESHPPKPKEIKLLSEKKETAKSQLFKSSNPYQKTKFTQKTENNYDIMLKKLKNKDYKDFNNNIINNIINPDEKIFQISNDMKNNSNNLNKKDLINDFLNRNEEYLKEKQNNNKTVNERLYIAYDNSQKRYFNNKGEEQEYFDDFYNKQLDLKNKYQMNLDRLTQKVNEENEKKYKPEPKKNNNLNYFKNNNPVELSKFMTEYKKNIENKKDIDNEKNSSMQSKNKKNSNNQSNGQTKEINNIVNKTSKKEESKKDISFNNNNNNNNNKKNKGDNKNKLTKKEIDELTNKLHYEGELLKVKKQTMISEEYAKNPIYHNFSKDKLSRSSLIILIKKFLYEYSIAIKKNSLLDCVKNPKLNYDQYIYTLKDLYYLEMEALPEDYLEEGTMYKELWDKLTKFSKGIENSLESNVLLLYFLELNGFFRNEKIIKELEPEIFWIKLQDYEDLIANAKFIEDNWDDLKLRKIEIIKRLKLLKKYNPIHNEEIFGNNINNNNQNIYQNDIKETNHYITIIKGNTNYELIHGYSSKKKSNEIDGFLELSNSNNGLNVHNSLNENNVNKQNPNRSSLINSYNEVLLKKKLDIENMKQNEEKKLKEVCTFKPTINSKINKKMFNTNINVDLPKYRKNRSTQLFNNKNGKNTNYNLTANNFNNRESYQPKSPLGKSMNLNNQEQKEKTLKLRKNKSNLEKMFKTNPLKNDKTFNERVQILKMVKSNEINDDNYMITPMRFNIDYPSKFEGIGVSINRDSSIKQSSSNIIFYNIKVNDKIRTLKYIEGDDLKLNVINFVKKNKLPDEVTIIILNKIKEKELEEKMNNK